MQKKKRSREEQERSLNKLPKSLLNMFHGAVIRESINSKAIYQSSTIGGLCFSNWMLISCPSMSYSKTTCPIRLGNKHTHCCHTASYMLQEYRQDSINHQNSCYIICTASRCMNFQSCQRGNPCHTGRGRPGSCLYRRVLRQLPLGQMLARGLLVRQVLVLRGRRSR